MSFTKRIYGDYNLSTAANATANVTLTTHTVFIQGNLFVGGNSTSVSKTDLDITDNTIVLNKGELGAGITLGTAGVDVDRGSEPTVRIRYNEPTETWQITNDGTTYTNVGISSGAGGITAIIDDPTPKLGGNLDVLHRTIFSSNTQQVKLDSNLAVKIESVNTPTAIAGYNTLYAAAPGTGGSGVYQTSLTNSDELISRRKSVWYSLIL
jgi:hypothetical protein